MEKIKETDEQILDMMSENEGRAFALLYKKYWQPLLHFAARYLDDKQECEEMTQELFIGLHSRRFTLKINSSISAYLHTALRNKIFNYLRNQAVYRRHIHIAANKTNRTQNNVEQFIYMKELQEEISFSLNCMPSKYREVYLLHDQGYLTVKKISALLSRPVDTVEKQLRRAKKMLQNCLLSYNHRAKENKPVKMQRSFLCHEQVAGLVKSSL